MNVVIGDNNNSLAGVRDAINAADIGVTANIINDGSGYRLVLASDELGAANSMRDQRGRGYHAGLSALAFNASASTPDTNMTQTVAAEDAQAAIDGIPITRDSNTVSGVVDGLTFNLQCDERRRAGGRLRLPRTRRVLPTRCRRSSMHSTTCVR